MPSPAWVSVAGPTRRCHGCRPRSTGKTNTIPSAAQAPSLPLEAASPPSLAPGAFPAGSRYVMSDAEAAVVAVRARHSQKFSDTGISRALRWRPPGAGRLSNPRPPLPGFVSARRRRCQPMRGDRADQAAVWGKTRRPPISGPTARHCWRCRADHASMTSTEGNPRSIRARSLTGGWCRPPSDIRHDGLIST
jgi:hypothetical protein